MKELTAEQRRGLRTLIYFCLLLGLLSLLVAASYTWFLLSKQPRVSDMDMSINTTTGVEIAADWAAPDEAWGQKVDFLDLVTQAAPLKPITWSEQEQSFLTMHYGMDGRMTGEYDTLSEEQNANRDDSDGYYVTGTFYMRTKTGCTISLTDAVELNGGQNGAGTYVIGAPVWDGETLTHSDGGYGAETAIRVGLEFAPVDPDTGQDSDEAVFMIYEPNCDAHISGDSEYRPTPSVDGTDTLIDEEHLILQTASSWSEAYPVQREVTIKNLGEFTTQNTRLFDLGRDEIYRIKIYVWLEGQDEDCTNILGEAQILANMQFDADYSEMQSGLEEIP